MPPAPVTQAPPDLSGAAYKSGPVNFPGGAGQALMVSSAPARAATTSNVTKLQQITTPAPATTPAPTSSTTKSTETAPAITTPAAQTTLKQDQEKAANQGKPGYDVLGNPISATPDNGSGSPSTPKSPYDSAVASIKDPGLAAMYKTSLQDIDKQIETAHTNLDNAAALSQNDPAAQAAIAGIKAKYALQIQLMQDKNKQLLGRASTSVAAFGGLGTMSQSFLNDQQSKADERISVLQAREQDEVTKMQIAYQTKDFKALDAATKAYDAANKEKLGALGKLLTETNKQVTQMQAQERIDAAAEKQAVSLDISKSTNLGTSIAKSIAESGITDEGQIDEYLQSIADEYGITNPDILKSAVEKARQASIKSLAGSANTLDAIRARNTPKAVKTPRSKFNSSDAVGKVTPQMAKAKGEDGYVDPTKWLAARENWMSLGGTAASFNSNFKQYLNPASYKQAGFSTTAAPSQYAL